MEDKILKEFEEACSKVYYAFEKEWNAIDDLAKEDRLQREKGAILGRQEERDFYLSEIRNIIESQALRDCPYPAWYPSLEEGIFAELYGLSGLAPWVYDQTEKYKDSSSAKLIGDRLYCMIDGRAQLQPQKISRSRREVLKRALLMATPEERIEKGFHEVYLNNGIRVSIYSGDRTKDDQDVIVFRKYLIEEPSFERIASLGTIPPEACQLFKTMVSLGFNVLFSGPVRSGKTTFLQTWQCYEDSSLEGLAIATDPETPWHKLMPNAPIMQIVADGPQLEMVLKSILRGDNDYVLLEEMRDAIAYKLALEITSTGTRRSKATIHGSDGIGLPYKVASQVICTYGGDLRQTIAQFFQNFDYAFFFEQAEDNRAKKYLVDIYEYCYDQKMDQAQIWNICSYSWKEKTWKWQYHLGDDKEKLISSMPRERERFAELLKELAIKNPLENKGAIIPNYYHASP